MTFSIGYAEREINPPPSIELAGFAGAENRKCSRVLDPLLVKVLIVDDGIQNSVIIVYDSLGLDYEIVAEIKKWISNRGVLQSKDILISTTHTHSAPAAISLLRNAGEKNSGYVRCLVEKTMEAFDDSAQQNQEARLSFGSTTFNWAINRCAYNPEDVIDPRVLVIRVDAAEKTIILFSYACHPVIMSGSEVSSDYVGYARKMIEDSNVAGKQRTFSMFLNGCAGNINPYDHEKKERLDGRGPLFAQKMGFELGEAVNRVIPKTQALPETKVMNDLRTIMVLEKTTKAGITSHPVDIQVMQLASIRLITIPGEPFVETGLWMKQNLGNYIIPIGYANGNIGYIPVPDIYDYTKVCYYEKFDAPKYYGIEVPTDLEPKIRETAELLVKEQQKRE